MLGYAQIRQRIRQKEYILGLKSQQNVSNHIPHSKTFFNIDTSHIVILKMGRMDEEQAVFEQLTLSGSRIPQD